MTPGQVYPIQRLTALVPIDDSIVWSGSYVLYGYLYWVSVSTWSYLHVTLLVYGRHRRPPVLISSVCKRKLVGSVIHQLEAHTAYGCVKLQLYKRHISIYFFKLVKAIIDVCKRQHSIGNVVRKARTSLVFCL